MEKVLQILNDLEGEGIIKGYALGGATALLFYAEPALTYDVDVFIFLSEPKNQTSQFINLGPLYEALEKKGYQAKKEHIMIEGIPVQFLPAYDTLIEEAVKRAAIKNYQGIQAKVIRIEHLLAIMLQTNRPKDRERIGKLLEEKITIDDDELLKILSRHNLREMWGKIVGKTKQTN